MNKNKKFEIEILKRLASDYCYEIKISWNGEVRMWQVFEETNDYKYKNTTMALLDWYEIVRDSHKEFNDWGVELEYIESVILES